MSFRAPLDRGYLDSLSSERPGFAFADLVESAQSWTCYVVDGRGRLGVDAAGDLATVAPSPETAAWLLGQTSDGVIHCAVAVDISIRAGADFLAVESIRFVHLTEIAADLPDDHALLAMQAVSLGRWHADNRFCSRCASPVRPTDAGWATLCSGCGAVEYPRTDPAVIVRVTDSEDRILLAHNVAWDEKRMSLPAGYVEAGETPARTVVRELYEEVGLRVERVEYVGAQPWPGPRSLMLAFAARVDVQRGFEAAAADAATSEPLRPPELRPDGLEIDRARFFTREEYREALSSGAVTAPGRASIAHAMLAQWLGESLPEQASSPPRRGR